MPCLSVNNMEEVAILTSTEFYSGRPFCYIYIHIHKIIIYMCLYCHNCYNSASDANVSFKCEKSANL